MSVQVASNRFIVSSVTKSVTLYQYLVETSSTLEETAKFLIGKAEAAQVLRKTDDLEEISEILCSFPIKQVRIIGIYYKGLCELRRGEDARNKFQEVAEDSGAYKAKALMCLAAIEAKRDNYAGELGYFVQAMKSATDVSSKVEISRGIAVVKAKEGDHKESLGDLVKLYPLVKHITPHYHFRYLNSLAVELCEAGQQEEAENFSKIILASPFALIYPEVQQTADEINVRGNGSSKSAISVEKDTRLLNVSEGTFPQGACSLVEQDERMRESVAGVTSLAEWKAQMPKRQQREIEEVEDVSLTEKENEIRQLINEVDITHQEADAILEILRKNKTQNSREL